MIKYRWYHQHQTDFAGEFEFAKLLFLTYEMTIFKLHYAGICLPCYL